MTRCVVHRAWAFGLAAALWLGHADAALAQQAGISLSADANLRFGTFAVVSSGWRNVSAAGTVTDSGVFAVNTSGIGPAQFTVSYDRGSGNTSAVTITFALLLANSGSVTQSGVTGTLSNFDTDLGGLTLFLPGQTILANISNCTTRICSRSFRVGGRIDVTRSSGGAALSVPLPITVNLIGVF